MTNVDSNRVYVVSLRDGGPTTGSAHLAERRRRQPESTGTKLEATGPDGQSTAQLPGLSLAQEAAVDSACRGPSTLATLKDILPNAEKRTGNRTSAISSAPRSSAGSSQLGRHVWQWPLLGRS